MQSRRGRVSWSLPWSSTYVNGSCLIFLWLIFVDSGYIGKKRKDRKICAYSAECGRKEKDSNQPRPCICMLNNWTFDEMKHKGKTAIRHFISIHHDHHLSLSSPPPPPCLPDACTCCTVVEVERRVRGKVFTLWHLVQANSLISQFVRLLSQSCLNIKLKMAPDNVNAWLSPWSARTHDVGDRIVTLLWFTWIILFYSPRPSSCAHQYLQ